MATEGRLRGVIEVHDFDGSAADTVEPTINKYIQASVRKHETARKVAMNVLFVFGELTGAGKKEVANVARHGSVRLNSEMLKTITRHKEEGAEVIMLTSNGHSKQVEEIMARNGVGVKAIHCDSRKKADFIMELVTQNPDRRVVSVNDSPLETLQAFAKGLGTNLVLFSGSHNFVPAQLIRLLRIARVSDSRSMDQTIRKAVEA